MRGTEAAEPEPADTHTLRAATDITAQEWAVGLRAVPAGSQRWQGSSTALNLNRCVSMPPFPL